MAAKFQDDRRRGQFGGFMPAGPGAANRKQNNVWGSILQEESLTSDLTGVQVGRRSLREIGSDRGAETYDYLLAQEHAATERADAETMRAREREEELDRELHTYWCKGDRESGPKEPAADEDNMDTGTDDRRADALAAGKKRSVKDRVGVRKGGGGGDGHGMHRHHGVVTGDFDDLSIAQPGVPRSIPDIDLTVIEDAVNADGAAASALLGKEIAIKLSEPKSDLITGVVELVGRDVALDLFQQTRKIEGGGGMMIKNGSRRRTPGGLYLQLLRDRAKEDTRIDENKVRSFFAQSNQTVSGGKKRKRNHQRNRGENFSAELMDFKRFSNDVKEKEKRRQEEDEAKSEVEMSEDAGAAGAVGGVGVDLEEGEVSGGGDADSDGEEEELKPLPDILTCISQKFRQGPSSSGQAERPSAPAPGSSSSSSSMPFVEPEAPPNSVEGAEDGRALNAYEDDDDFLNTNCDTEDIEIF